MKSYKGAIIIGGVLLCIICVIGILFDTTQESKHIVLHAKVDEYNSLSEVESNSDIIVYGKKVHEDEPTFIKNEDDIVLAQYTLSDFEISSIKTNKINSDLNVGDKIKILENETYNKNENVTYHIAGYCKMETNNNYLLFLQYSEDNEWYIPTGVTVGKIPIDTSEPIVLTDNKHEINRVKSIVKKARNEYKKLK